MSFNPDMLVIGRKAESLSQEQLAMRLDISQSKLSKLENGLLEPSDEDTLALANALGRPRSFLEQSGHQVATQASWYHHRKQRTTPAKAVGRIHAVLDIVRLELMRLIEGVPLPERRFSPIDADEHDGDIEHIAGIVRAWWGVPAGPVENVTRLIEQNGGIVVGFDFGTRKVDALSLVRTEHPPLFFINSAMPADRIRWSLVHELGHVLLHGHPTGEKAMENEADRFASEFLMPRRDIEREFCPPVRLMDLAGMKPLWKVAIQALVMRAFHIGVISDRRKQRLFIEISQRGWRTQEPKPLPPEPPRLIEEVIEYHRRKLGNSVDDLAAIARTSAERFKHQYLGARQPLRVVSND